MTTRSSSLDVARFCGLAPGLSEGYGSGRAAALSNYVHALVGGSSEDAERARLSLTPEEQAEASEYLVPEPLEIHGRTLLLEHAQREGEIALDLGDGVVVPGHYDLRWLITREDGRPWVVVVDMKRSRYTSSVDSLQLASYGAASALELGAEGYTPAIWVLDGGDYIIGKDVDLMDFAFAHTWELLRHAATNVSDTGNMGSHCSGCFGRLHCPEYLFPPTAAAGLGAFTSPDAVTFLTPEHALELLNDAQRMIDTGEALKANLKAWADVNGGIRDGNGKVYRAVFSKGRKTVKLKMLQLRYPEIAEELTETGAGFYSHRWVNDKPRKS